MTIRQIQCLLVYLGYDPGAIDGADGSQTRAAVKAFQAAEGLEPDGIAGQQTQARLREAVASGEKPVGDKMSATDDKMSAIADWWDEIQYFTPDEPNICCPCPRCVGKKEYPTEALMRKADSIRGELGPMVPSSVRRCQAHNDELSGSAKNSRHIIGKAMDFNCPKSTPAQIEACLARRKAAGEIRYWYRMSSGWYHFDID